MAHGCSGCKFYISELATIVLIKVDTDVISPFSECNQGKPPPIMALSRLEVSQMVFSMLENPLC